MKIPATQWWHAEGEKIVCDLCPRECRLQDGQRGFCFVRQNVGMEMVLTTYGKSTGFCIDPIEKKPLNHFLPGTPVLSFGTAGCNLGCKFCQNWDISKSREIEILSQTASPEAIVDAAKNAGCRSIAFTYNDPVIWAEYAIETAKVARQAGIKTVAVTAGYITPAARPAFYEHMDAANVDLKAFTDLFYCKVTFAHLDPVLETLRWLKHESPVWFEITNLMIPGENDSPAETQRMCDWILENLGPDVPLHFSGFHPDFKMRDKPNTPRETLLCAREIARKTGIKFAYVGNVLDPEGQSTTCPKCHALLIERNHYQLGHYAIRDGHCAKCGESIPGVFENQRGDWGRKRLPVRVRDSSPPAPPAPLEYNPNQVDALLKFARGVVEGTVRNQPAAPLPATLAQAPEFGMFVTLRRGKHLRGCLGNWSGETPETLGALIQKSAEKVATSDPRFPPIHEAELPHLAVEISPMFGLAPVAETGEARENAVRVGEHGLFITHPRGRGLLLPQVATEQGWDARTFLDQVCVKARLPKATWKRPEATLSTFRGRHYISPPPKPEFEPSRIPASLWAEVFQYVSARLAGSNDGTFPTLPEDEAALPPGGIMLQGAHGLTTVAFRAGASLRELVDHGCANLLRAAQTQGKTIDRILRILCFSHPLPLRPEDDPRRRRSLGQDAVAGRLGPKFSLSLGHAQGGDAVQQTLKGLEVNEADWKSSGASLLAYRVFGVNANETSPAAAVRFTRHAAVAGMFYPRGAQAIQEELRRYFQNPVPAQAFDAVLLPHAGWRFCGEIIAETLAGVKVPDLVIVIGPKHTRHGADWSISAATSWKMPHTEIPVATEWVKFLADRVPGLVRENEAHREEHGCEVLLPFLHHRNPGLRVVPLAIGRGTPNDLQPLAKALSALREAGPGDPPLLVISSDMNHFANDTENRRLDHLALDRFKASEPEVLFAVCQREQISMCGLRPAVAVLQALGQCEVNVVRYDTSATVSGDTSRVVGYAGATLRVKR